MSMGKGSAPSAPNPTQVGNEQINVNQQTLNALAAANHVNTSNPLLGGTTWTGSPGGPYTETTNYSPAVQQQIVQQLTNQDLGLGTYGNAEQRLIGQTTPGSAIDTSKLPTIQTGAAANSGGIQANANAGGGQGMQRNLSGASMGDPAIAQAQQAVYGQLTSRLDPMWSQAQETLQSGLTAQGIPQNSEAWNRAMDTFNQQKTDAYNTASNQATQTGIGLQAQMFGQGTTAGTFANQAQSQNFQQLMAQAGFTNTAQQQQFMEQAQQAGMTNQAAAQALQQMIAERAAPINEVNSLASGAQVSNPAAGIATGSPSTYGAPNMTAANQLGYQGQLNQYNASVGQGQSLMGSLLQAGQMPTNSVGGGLLGAIGSGLGGLLGKGGPAASATSIASIPLTAAEIGGL